MPTIEEIAGLPVQELNGALGAGIADISQQRDVCLFTYTRKVLPADGFIFWIRTGAFTIKGMLHHSADRDQAETETATTNSVVLTTLQPLQSLNAMNTDVLIVGEVEGVRYAFSRHGYFAEQPAVWVYTGDSLLPAFATQLLDDPQQFNALELIVSDSLPAWLAIASYNPIWLLPPNPGIPLYPSFAVPDNITPPYGVVHNDPDGIRALQAVPLLLPYTLPNNSIGTRHTQLTAERVRITLYGVGNDLAQDFLDTCLRYMLDTDIIGLMNMPAVRDGKRTWREGMVLAQQKFIDFEVSFIQSRVIDLAQQLIEQAATTVQTIPPSPIVVASASYVPV